VILLFIRDKLIRKMKEKIISSKGILNLIPEEFFEENRENME
jgi:hypothetical protein